MSKHKDIFEAIRNNDVEGVKYFIFEKKVDINKPSEGYDQLVPLNTALSNGNMEIIKILVDAGADVNKGYVYSGHGLDYVPMSSVFNFSLPEEKNEEEEEQNEEERKRKEEKKKELECERIIEMIDFLHSNGARINPTTDEVSYPPLHEACSSGMFPVVKFLVSKKGADVNLPNQNKLGAIYYACLSGNKEIVKYLVNEGAEMTFVCAYLPIQNEDDEFLKFVLVQDKIDFSTPSMKEIKSRDKIGKPKLEEEGERDDEEEGEDCEDSWDEDPYRRLVLDSVEYCDVLREFLDDQEAFIEKYKKEV